MGAQSLFTTTHSLQRQKSKSFVRPFGLISRGKALIFQLVFGREELPAN